MGGAETPPKLMIDRPRTILRSDLEVPAGRDYPLDMATMGARSIPSTDVALR
jgi:hypothetical protein